VKLENSEIVGTPAPFLFAKVAKNKGKRQINHGYLDISYEKDEIFTDNSNSLL
jgi:hypothetical protein